MGDTARLITVPFSHYVEKARWALEHAGVAFVEEGHVPLLHWTATFRAGGQRTVPVLVVGGRVLADSTDILGYADQHASDGRRLYPATPAARRECEELEDYFDTKLGPDTRRVAYYHLLSDTRTTAAMFARGVPAWERTVAPWFTPLARVVLRRGLRLDPRGVARSIQRIDEAFARVAARLTDGRRYLLGENFTAADLTFAALCAPVIAPPEYGVPLPRVETMPPPLAALVARLRASPAGAFALRLYRDERRLN